MTKNSILNIQVCKIYFALIDNVQSIVDGDDRFHKVITFNEGKDWEEIYSTPGSIEFTENPKDNEAGNLIEQMIKFSFPGEDDLNLKDLDAVINRPVIVKVEYSSALMKLIGAIENPAKIARAIQQTAKSSGSTMEISCLAPVNARWITVPD